MRALMGLLVAVAALSPFLSVRMLAQQNQVYRVGDGIVVPKVVKEVKPTYTAAARAARVEGIVTLECVVRADGTPEAIRVTRPLDPQLDEAASRALGQWIFVPGTKDGVPVPVVVDVEISFALTDDAAVLKGPAVDSPDVFRPGKGITTPVVVRDVKPGYPPTAMSDGAQGTVYLECVVLPDGTVGDVRLKGRAHPDLDEEAVRSLLRWTFKPGTKDGIAVPVQVEVQMSFSLGSGRSPQKR